MQKTENNKPVVIEIQPESNHSSHKKRSDTARVASAFEKILPNVLQCAIKVEQHEEYLSDIYERQERIRIKLIEVETRQGVQIFELSQKMEKLLARLELLELNQTQAEDEAEVNPEQTTPPSQMYS